MFVYVRVYVGVPWSGVAWSDELYVEKSNYVGKYYYIFLHASLR